MLLVNLPNVAGKFGVFYHKKKKYRILSISSRKYPKKSNFHRRCGLLKLYKICTDNYDNNEYLVVKYISFFYQPYHLMFVMQYLLMSRNDDMKMKLQKRRKFFSKTTLSSLWNANF